MEREDEKLRSMLQKKLGNYYLLKENYQVSLLKYSENYTWLIEDEAGKKVLRQCRPGYHTREELESELSWIACLGEQTDIKMPRIIPDKEGKFLCEINGYVCTMFSFLEGSTLRGIEGKTLEKYLFEIGKIAAVLHNQVQQWKEAGDLSRFTWDFEDLIGEKARVGDWKAHPGLTKDEREIFEKAVPIIKKRLENYGKSPDRYGLIHSDLNINNVIVNGEIVQILDFDDCGFGWFLYDLSTSVLEYDVGIEDKINAWIRGYETVRMLSDEDKAMIPTFIVMRKIVRIGWIASHIENDTVKKVAADYYSQTALMAEKYVETRGEVFI